MILSIKDLIEIKERLPDADDYVKINKTNCIIYELKNPIKRCHANGEIRIDDVSATQIKLEARQYYKNNIMFYKWVYNGEISL